MEKDNRKRVDVYNVTSNGYSFHLKRNGDCSVFCRRDESYRRNTPLQKAISEIINWARTSGIYFFQWHLEHPFDGGLYHKNQSHKFKPSNLKWPTKIFEL